MLRAIRELRKELQALKRKRKDSAQESTDPPKTNGSAPARSKKVSETKGQAAKPKASEITLPQDNTTTTASHPEEEEAQFI